MTRLTDRLAEWLGDDAEPPPPNEVDAPTLWARERSFTTRVLGDLADDQPPRSAFLLLAAHGIALAGRDRHRTQLTVLADRAGVSRRTASDTTGWFVRNEWLTMTAARRFTAGPKWMTALDDHHAKFAAYGVVNLAWLELLRPQPDRAALARTALAVACLIGRQRSRLLTVADIAAVTDEPTKPARTRVARLRDLGLIVVDSGSVRIGETWPTP